MSDVTSLKDYFLNRKPVEALVAVYEADEEICSSQISSRVDATYSHTVRIVAALEEQDLLRTYKKGRKKISTLTPEGKQFARNFSNLFDIIDRHES